MKDLLALSEEKELHNFQKEKAKEIAQEFKTKLKTIDSEMKSPPSLYNPFRGRRESGMVLDDIDLNKVTRWLQTPVSHEKQLRQLSKMLFNSSGEYKSLIQYFVSMARFYYVFEFSGDRDSHAPKTIKNELKILSSEFSKMNIAHEKAKIFDVVMKEDVYYGYEVSDKHSFFFLRLDPDFCRLSGQADGMWTFEFDFSYFNTRKHLLDSYPNEFRTKYNMLTNSGNLEEYKWQQLDFNKTVAYKFNETQTEVVPPLASTFSGLMELNEYRKLKKVNAKIDNYIILHQKVPIFKDSDKTFQQNNFMIDSDTMHMFHQMLAGSLPDEIGAVVSPMEIEPLKLDKSREPSDKVAEATRDIYNSAGVNQFLFNPDKNSTAGLSKSIQKDEALVMQFYLQVARWMQRKIKLNHPKWSHWSVKLLSTTSVSEKEYADFLVQLGTLGFPVVGAISSMIGYDINKIESMSYLENEVLNLKELMIPFASSHTGGNIATNKNGTEENDDVGGRPVLDDDVISESGQANRDSNNGTEGSEK